MRKFQNYIGLLIAASLVSVPVSAFAQSSDVNQPETNQTQTGEDPAVTSIKKSLIANTPITEAQLGEIPTEFWTTVLQEAQSGEVDLVAMWEKILTQYPAIFEDSIQALRAQLKTQYQLTDKELDQYTNKTLLMKEFTIRQANNNTPDLEKLSKEIRKVVPATPTTEPGEGEDDTGQPTTSSTTSTTTTTAEASAFDFAQFKKIMIETTPIIQAELDQISQEQWQALVDEVTKAGGDPSGTFTLAMQRYPEVFEGETARLYQTLVNQYRFDDSKLRSAVDANTLRWYDLMTLDSQGNTNFQALADKIVAEKGSDLQVSADGLKKSLIEATPLTDAQFNAITPAQWKTMQDTLKASGFGDISSLYNKAVATYPKVFETEYQEYRKVLVDQYKVDGAKLDKVPRSEVLWDAYLNRDNKGNLNYQNMLKDITVKYDVMAASGATTTDQAAVIAHVKQVLIAKTPMTEAQFNILPAEAILKVASTIDQNYAAIYNDFLAAYPQVFKAEVDTIRAELVKLGLTQASVNTIKDQVLLWYDFEAYLANNNKTNFKGLADRLVKEGLASWAVQVDKKKAQLPNTGETSSALLPIFGLAMIVGGAGYTAYNRKFNHSDDSDS